MEMFLVFALGVVHVARGDDDDDEPLAVNEGFTIFLWS